MYRLQPKNNKMYILKTTANFNNGGSGTDNYNDLSNKPKINNVELNGNKTLEELDIQQNMNITSQDINNWNNKSDFSGNYNDLSNKPTIPTIPENVSAFNNDAEYTTKTYVDDIVGDIETILTTITTGGGVN